MSSRPLALLWTTGGALARYRAMAMVVGAGLATVCFVGIPLQVVGHNKWPWTSVVQIVGTAHGFFYIIYLITCLDLAGRARFRTLQLLGMVGSGLLPLLAFYMERKVTERVKAQLALGDAAPPGPAATVWGALIRRPARQSRRAPVSPSPGSGPEQVSSRSEQRALGAGHEPVEELSGDGG